MKVWIDCSVCESNLAACDSCFGQLVVTGIPEGACILAYKDDGRETMTIFLHAEDYEEMLIIPPDMRERVAYDGWSRYVSFEPRFRRNEGTECLKETR